jgi:hypothetical protein
VLQESAGGADDDVAGGHAAALELEVLAADDEAGREVVEPANLAQGLEDLGSMLRLLFFERFPQFF